MSILLKDKDDKDVEAFVDDPGGMVDALLRADTEADWLTGAVFYGLLVDNGEGDLVNAPGVDISIIGPVVLTPGVYGLNGVVITPPVMDNRFHVNLRIHGIALTKIGEESHKKWQTMAMNWTVLGVDDTNGNKGERGKSLSKVTLVDPASINSRINVWL